MTFNQKRDVVTRAARYQSARRVGLAEFDGQKMAVVLQRGRNEVVLRGNAAFVRDDAVGNSLRISLDGDEAGQPIVILAEDEWNGRIIPDFHHGCDFCLILN